LAGPKLKAFDSVIKPRTEGMTPFELDYHHVIHTAGMVADKKIRGAQEATYSIAFLLSVGIESGKN
jgi:hypothetical protein